MKEFSKKQSGVSVNNENEIKSISLSSFNKPHKNVLNSNTKNNYNNITHHQSSNLSKTNNLGLGKLPIPNNHNTLRLSDKNLIAPLNNKILKTCGDENNNFFKIKKSKSDSNKDVDEIKIRKDYNGNLILKGSKSHHIVFSDNLLDKKPLIDIIEVESYKKENINEFLSDDYYGYDNNYPNYSGTCLIF